MRNIALIIIALVSCINYACKQPKFKTVHGKKAPYSISIPVEYADDIQFKGDNPLIDLEYRNSKGESVVIGVMDMPPEDTNNYFKQFNALSDSEFIEKIGSRKESNLKIIDRKIIEVNGVSSYFVYYQSDKLYSQVLFQITHGKMLNLSVGYNYSKNDSLKSYYYQIVNSIVWDKE